MTDVAPDLSSDLASDLAPTGTLRASINLGNAVLAGGTPEDPSGVTVDLARELGRRLGLEVELLCFDAARKSLEAMVDGRADLCFLAIDPAREDEVAFTAPYVLIEGVYVVPASSSVESPADVDRAGVRVGVKQGSAYDLHLTRSLEHAELVRGAEGVTVFEDSGLEAGAGIRQPTEAWAVTRPGVRVVEEAFMQIRQAVGVPRSRSAETIAYVASYVEEVKASGFVRASLDAAGRADTTVAPPV